MRFQRIRLKNYIGIFNGMELHEINIDLSKCIHKILVIKGDNGAGKTTLFDALHIFPDHNDKIIDKEQGEKELWISDGDISYNILIIHPVQKDGSRAQTKAYIKKMIDNTFVELNDNGNISSFKDIISEELGLDPNFISLSQLSSANRGLADKSPAERKKYVALLLNSIEVYNNINKVMCKRSSVFKSMINSLVSKIDNIGDEEKLKLSLCSIENRINVMLNNKDLLIKKLSESESIIKIIDPDTSIQTLYDSICTELESLNDRINKNSTFIDNLYEVLNINDLNIEGILNIYNTIKDNINSLTAENYAKELYIKNLLSDRESEARDIQLKTQRLKSIQSECNFIELENTIKANENKIKEYENIFNSIGVTDALSISKNEYIIGLNTLKEIKETVDIFKSTMEYEVIQTSIDYIRCEINPMENINVLEQQIDDINKTILDKSTKYSQYSSMVDKMSSLNMRPNECKLDDCPFIKEALEISKLDPENNIKKLSKDISDCNKELERVKNDKSKQELILSCIQYINILIRNINNNSTILTKLPNGIIFSDKDVFLNRLYDGDNFDSINDIYKYIEYANIFEEYKLTKDILYKLKVDYNVYKSKNDIIDELMNDIENISNKLNSITSNIENNNKELFESKKKIQEYNDLLVKYDNLITAYNTNKLLKDKKQELKSQFNSIKSNMIKIKENIDNINNINCSINNISAEIKPLMDERDKMKFGLSMLQQYKSEYTIYNEKYRYIETVKKYSTPTKDGIQLLFMKLYMGKTLNMANELLSLLFDGEFMLGQYVINTDEFRIPCIGSGLPHDDISSMSTSQVCMISMILSYTLSRQSSAKYDILKLDEIDGGLDSINRAQFIQLLDKISPEQTIMISHNSELDLSNTDLIILKDTTNESYNGNIIYRYQNNY